MPENAKRNVAWNKFLYNRTEAAALLGVPRSMVLRCIAVRELDTRTIAEKQFVTRGSLAKLFKRLHGTEAPIPPPGRDVPQDTVAT